jgi:hypothetical protein
MHQIMGSSENGDDYRLNMCRSMGDMLEMSHNIDKNDACFPFLQTCYHIKILKVALKKTSLLL